MRTTAPPTAKATVAQAPVFSVEKHHSDNSDSIFGNPNNNDNGNGNGNGNSYDVIGASLLPFLHHASSNSNRERKYDSIGDATMREDAIPETGPGDFHNNSTRHERNNKPENEATLCGARDRYRYRDTTNDTRSKSHDCASLLLDGGRTYTASSIDGCNNGDNDRCFQPQEERNNNSQPTIRTTRKRILLRGPPRSGKSSLGMNLAYAEAKAENNCCGGLPCGCVAMIVYRPKVRRHSDNNNHNSNSNYYYYDDDDKYSSNGERFPLFCRAVSAQTGEVPAHKTNDRTKEGLQATTLRNAEVAAVTKRDEEDTWDANTLNRIRICRVSSVRDLWEDMLALAGKPLHERPIRAIVVEDLDLIIGSGGDPSNHNQTSGNNKKHNYLVSMMLKTVAIAADTALAIENSQNEYSSSSSRSNCVTLLVTLTMDPRQQQRDASMNTSNHSLRNVVRNVTDSSDVLVLASCIDTVVTLHQRQRCTDNMAQETNNDDDDDGETISCVWKKPISAATRNTIEATRIGDRDEDGNTNSKKKDKESNYANETILVNSVWQAEIQERGGDQYYRNIGDGFNGDDISVSLVDYAFVESFPAEDGTRSSGECEGLRDKVWGNKNRYFAEYIVIGHPKTRFPWENLPKGVVPNIHLSRFIAFLPKQPYTIVTRSDIFCLGFPKTGENFMDSNHYHNYVVQYHKVRFENETLGADFPTVHYIILGKPKTNQDEETASVIISYGEQD